MWRETIWRCFDSMMSYAVHHIDGWLRVTIYLLAGGLVFEVLKFISLLHSRL